MHRKTTVSSCDSVRHAGTDTHCIVACSLGPGGQVQSCGMQQAWAWWEGSIQPAGSSAGVRQNPCQELTGPISEGLRPHPCMLISPSEEPGSRAFALLWIQQQQSHDITWAGKPSGRNLGVGRTGLRDLRLRHAFSDESKAAEWESKSTDMTANTAWFMEEFKTKKLRRKLERYVGKRTHAHTKPPKKQEHSLKNMQAMAKEAFHHFSTIL